MCVMSQYVHDVLSSVVVGQKITFFKKFVTCVYDDTERCHNV